MLKIKSNDRAAQALVKELVSLLTEEGAFFSPAMQLEIKGSDFSYNRKKSLENGETLVSLPFRCMPYLDDFHWSLDADHKLQWKTIESPQSGCIELHTKIVDLQVRLYNQFGKLADMAKNFPVVQLADKKELVEQLLEFAQEHRFRSTLDKDLDQLLIHAFWHSRIFGDFRTQQIHIIPMMEFFDHNIFAGSFLLGSNERGGESLNLSYVESDGSKSLHARYEIMDNLHAYVKYGFVDDKAFFVQSQPFEIDLLDGVVRLEVSYQSASSNQCQVHEWNPVPAYSNSLMYRSRLRFLTDCVFVPYMMVPPERHLPAFNEALKAQLTEIEQARSLQKGELANASVMIEIKRALLNANESTYRSIAKAAKEAQLDPGAQVTRLLKKMLKHQGQILGEFKRSLD